MRRIIKKNFRAAALVISFCFVTTLIASPAFSRDRHFYRGHYGSHHVRVYRDGGVLPALLATGIIAGITFSLIDSAANAPAPRYPVAAQVYAPVAPPASYAPTGAAGSVSVTAQLLNVRSGPGLDAPMIRQVPYGTILAIYGDSPGWYYVGLPGNQYGWVMTQFTAPVRPSGAG